VVESQRYRDSAVRIGSSHNRDILYFRANAQMLLNMLHACYNAVPMQMIHRSSKNSFSVLVRHRTVCSLQPKHQVNTHPPSFHVKFSSSFPNVPHYPPQFHRSYLPQVVNGVVYLPCNLYIVMRGQNNHFTWQLSLNTARVVRRCANGDQDLQQD
jgi:hypothetical protein